MSLDVSKILIVLLLIAIILLALKLLKKQKIKQTRYKSDSGDTVKSRAEVELINSCHWALNSYYDQIKSGNILA